jgi:FtsP/CotA-like multicopper oxidase with cupredoxin domain
MNRPRWKRTGTALALGALLAAVGAMQITISSADAQTAGDSGVVCTTNPQSTFDLTATTGSVSIPDGNTIFMWSYALGSGASAPFQLPGPTLCVTQGDIVTIHLHNVLSEPTSIVFPGQDNVEADGSPSQPVPGAGTITSLTQPAPPNGTVTYRFVATEPGTYLYESGTDQAKQVQMGLYGALVIRPAGHPNWAYNDASSVFNPNTEYVFLLSEVDPDLHQAVERGQPYDAAATHPRYWMINGRSFPDTIAPNGAPWLPDQPYSAMVHIQPKTNSNPDPALFRYLNVGSLHHPMHPHGNHGRVIARDGRLLNDNGQDLSYEKFLVLVGAGQTWDTTFNWTDRELWTPSNPIPVTLPQLQNLTFKGNATWYSGSPYLGHQDELPAGVTSYNQCGEFYHVSHSHALNEAANFEAGFGGMLTLIRIDPPGGCP